MAHQVDKQKPRLTDEFNAVVEMCGDKFKDVGDRCGHYAYFLHGADAMQDRIAELEQERDQLKAQNTALSEKLGSIRDGLYGHGYQVAEFHMNGELEPLDSWFENNDWEPEESPACLAEIQAKAIEDFKDELVKSVSILYRPHIEGVCAVVKDRIFQHPTPTDISTQVVEEQLQVNEPVAIRAIDNCTGDRDIYECLAFIDEQGVWKSWESSMPILTHEGDEIIEWWSLKPGSGNKSDNHPNSTS